MEYLLIMESKGEVIKDSIESFMPYSTILFSLD